MEPTKKLIYIVVGGVLFAGALAYAITSKRDAIEQARNEVTTLRGNIEVARKTIEGTAALEREVIVLREMSEVISEILPDSEDVNNLIRTFHDFADVAGVKTTSYKRKVDHGRAQQSDFDLVGYTLTIEGDIFQVMSLMDQLETHRRFISIPSFKITAATRKSVEDEGVAQHKTKLDIETYKFDQAQNDRPVRIEGYERKRDLLAGEIARRRQALALAKFTYRGPRGRRDPWIDPRVPALDIMSALTVAEQMDIVEGLQGRVSDASGNYKNIEEAENVLAALVERRELEKKLAFIEEDLRRLDEEGAISYVPAQKRMKKDVYEPLDELRENLTDGQATVGPAKEMLVEVRDAMNRHLDLGEYVLSLQTYNTVKDDLSAVQGDPIRVELAEQIVQLAEDAKTLRDFDKIAIDIGGVAIMEGSPSAVLINGRSFLVGDMIDGELEVFEISPSTIDFIFRGVILTRVF